MRRAQMLALAASALLAIGFSVAAKPSPIVLWNASASAPIGLYAVLPCDRLAIGEFVVARPPDALAKFLVARNYIGAGVVLIKRVAALDGQRVCRTDRLITVDGRSLGFAQSMDHLGRPLPVWRGCRTLDNARVFLMTASVPASLDGRYFGPLDRMTILGRAVPLWTFKGQK